jgi:hypothetical protein
MNLARIDKFLIGDNGRLQEKARGIFSELVRLLIVPDLQTRFLAEMALRDATYT